jgi:hypothetical protein
MSACVSARYAADLLTFSHFFFFALVFALQATYCKDVAIVQRQPLLLSTISANVLIKSERAQTGC